MNYKIIDINYQGLEPIYSNFYKRRVNMTDKKEPVREERVRWIGTTGYGTEQVYKINPCNNPSIADSFMVREVLPPLPYAEIERKIEEAAKIESQEMDRYGIPRTNHHDISVFTKGAHYALTLKKKSDVAEGIRLCLEALKSQPQEQTDCDDPRLPTSPTHFKYSADWLEKSMKERGMIE